MDTVTSWLARALFVAGFGFLGLACAEALVKLGGNSLVRDQFSAARLLELAAVLAVFALAIVLRQVRDELRKRSV